MCELVCKKCNLPFVNMRVLGIHIKRTHKMETKEYYDTYFKQPDEDKCPVCGKPTTFRSLAYGYNHHCCKECISKDTKVKEHKVQTCLDNWGVTNCFHSPNGRKQYYKIGTSKHKMIDRAVNKLMDSCDTIKNLKYIDKDTYSFDCTCCGEHRVQEHYITVHRIYNNLNPCLNCMPKNSLKSGLEKEMATYIKSIYSDIIIENDYTTIKPRELDVYLPNIKLAFEFDGTYWHADPRFYKEDDKIGDRSAKEIWKHDKMKFGICNRVGIKLIRIKEFDWRYNLEQTKEYIKTRIDENIKNITNKIVQ